MHCLLCQQAFPLAFGGTLLAVVSFLFLLSPVIRPPCPLTHRSPIKHTQQEVLPDMVEFMAKLREEITIGVVGGSDLPKQKEQLGESGEFSSHLA